MLVLSRKIGEEIVIDGNITVTVVAIHNGKVRLGVCANKDVPIDRREVHDKKVEAASHGS